MKSFEIDHTKLIPGIYKHSKSGLVTTWDVRIKKPNSGEYLDPAVIHTVEHTLASYLRTRYGNLRIVGIFPMGCQTGFYVLTRFMSNSAFYYAIEDYILNLQRRFSVPGTTEQQCGNYTLHNLKGAKDVMLDFYDEYLGEEIKISKYN